MKFNARNVYISPKAKIGRNVKIGDNATIYDNVEIGDNTIVCNDVVLGEPLNLYYSDPEYQNPPCVIGSDSIIRSHSIIYAGCTIRGALFSVFRTTHQAPGARESNAGTVPMAQCAVWRPSSTQRGHAAVCEWVTYSL